MTCKHRTFFNWLSKVIRQLRFGFTTVWDWLSSIIVKKVIGLVLVLVVRDSIESHSDIINSINYVTTCRHDLALQGFQWTTDTIQKKVDEIPYASDNRSEMLSRPHNISWQKNDEEMI